MDAKCRACRLRMGSEVQSARVKMESSRVEVSSTRVKISSMRVEISSTDVKMSDMSLMGFHTDLRTVKNPTYCPYANSTIQHCIKQSIRSSSSARHTMKTGSGSHP